MTCMTWVFLVYLGRIINNNQSGLRNVHVRLDKVVANPEWSDLFPTAHVQHLTSPRSDHKILLLSMRQGGNEEKVKRIFRYEVMWESEDALSSVIEKAWMNKHPGSDLGALVESLKAMTQELKQWSQNTFGHVTKKIESLRRELDILEGGDLDSE